MSQHNHPVQSSTSLRDLVCVMAQRYCLLVLILVITAAIGLLSYEFLGLNQALVAGLLFLCIAFWATSLVPAYWPALGLFAFATATQLAPTQVIFAGFQSSTFWLLFSGMVFGAAINHTGINSRATRLLMLILGNSYQGTIIKIALFAMALAFLIPLASAVSC
ncbi:anion permease [Marinomonas pontica]|uniref:anion permease n=1 Tax=Marinomonas pontica TaxID=264739 RepID=UPI002244C581|nr:anion permease [Marinomonas pontica]MCW8356176.1 anion permease [Marinomonas pontica]